MIHMLEYFFFEEYLGLFHKFGFAENMSHLLELDKMIGDCMKDVGSEEEDEDVTEDDLMVSDSGSTYHV